jgi:hypothetical protein
MLYSNKINKNTISLSMMEEILGFNEPEYSLSSDAKKIIENKQAGLTIYSTSDEIFALLDGLQIPYKGKKIEDVLNFLFDRLLFEYMEDQSYYNEESYDKFKNTSIYDQLQMLIYNVKILLLWTCNNDIKLMSRNCKILLRKKEIHPIDETNYLEKYEHFKMIMGIVKPERLAEYFNSLVGLKHFSIKTKAIYHAFVEELEIRDIEYDSILYGKEKMLSYNIDIVIKDSILTVIKIEL